MFKSVLHVLLILVIYSAQYARAEVKEYIRDYNYQSESYDTVTSSRVNAISGVKRELLEELGTYVGSVVKQNQDALGNSYMSHDVINITAGIVALKVLDEKWMQPVYYVKAGMKADPDDVLAKLKAMRADLELEKNLRNSYEELERARAELDSLKAQLAQLKKTTVAIVVAPAPSTPVVAEARTPESVIVKPVQVNAEPAQNELAKEESVQPAPVVALTPNPEAVAMPVPAAVPDAKKLVASYRLAVQNIEVEEAFQRGLVAQINGDFLSLTREMSALADKGYRSAQTKMGWIYERGMGVPQDYQKALQWYEKAAANGAKNAPAHIGNMYEKGYGVKQDYAKAAEYYKRSIELDGSLGYARMGYLHETGKGVQFDRVKAVEYYEKAIAKGSVHAMTLIGLLYQQGQGGLPRDEKKAVALYQQAIDHGDPLAMTRLGELYNQGKGGLPKDHEKAMALLKESARYHLPAAYAHLGRMYEEGWATRQDYAEARKWYEQAAEHDAIFAMRRLGLMYKEGLGMSRDWDKATYWFKRAAALGDDKSEKMLNKRANWR